MGQLACFGCDALRASAGVADLSCAELDAGLVAGLAGLSALVGFLSVF
jgi:hypothetical protein